jgi:prepilin-type N-terminal cleavage/methylation domain-containing protein
MSKQNLKFKIQNSKFRQGFTLVELMSVVVIMVILVTAVVINLASQRESRDIIIAENLLVSNIRMAQSYTLSARTLPNGQSPQYYALKFDMTRPTQYTIEAIFNVNSSPQMMDIQTVQLPNNIRFAAVNFPVFPIIIDRSAANDGYPTSTTATLTNDGFLQPVGANGCALIAFAAPFGKTIFNGGCSPTSPGSFPYTLQPTDDYQKIVNFRNNTGCDLNTNPPSCTASTDSQMTITLTNASNTLSKRIKVNAVSGIVSFN